MKADFRTKLYEGYVSKYKGATAERSEANLKEYFEWCRHRLLPHLEGLNSQAHILELGCGAGYVLEFLRGVGYENTCGIDVSQEQVEIGKRRGNNVIVADVFEFLGERADTFDVIIAIDFVEHFHKEELLTIFPLIHRSLSSSGHLVVQTPNGAGLFPFQVVYGDLTHLTIFTPTSMNQLLGSTGFENAVFTETIFPPINFRYKRRLVAWKIIKMIANIIRRIEANKFQEVWTENMICSCQKTQSSRWIASELR